MISPMTACRAWLDRYAVRRQRRREYFDLETQVGQLLQQLATVDDIARGTILGKAAALIEHQADVHDAAFGSDAWTDQYGAHTMTGTHRAEAAILRSIGAAYQGTRSTSGLGDCADKVLEVMVHTTIARLRLLDTLYQAVLPVVGVQAAEIVPAVRRAMMDETP